MTSASWPGPWWDGGLTRIPNAILECSAYLYESESTAKEGVKFGGCGLMVAGARRADNTAPGYIVTSGHVIGTYPVVRLVGSNNTTVILPLEVDHWRRHPKGDDLAIAHLSARLAPTVQGSAFDRHAFISEQDFLSDRLGIGSECFLVGRLANYEGQTNEPAIRFGRVSSRLTSVKLESGLHQQAFFADLRSLGGFSGAPVFAGIRTADGRISIQLVGIDCGHLRTRLKIVDAQGHHQAGMAAVGNSGMAVVVPAWKVAELVDILDREEPTSAPDRGPAAPA